MAQGDVELALALAWEAKDGLDDPDPAYRLPAARGRGKTGAENQWLLHHALPAGGRSLRPRPANL